MNDNLYQFVGIATSPSGVTKVKFSNDPLRVKKLDQSKFTNIKMIELPVIMDQEDAVAFIRELPEFADDLSQMAFVAFDDSAVPEKKTKPIQTHLFQHVVVTQKDNDSEPQLEFTNTGSQEYDGYWYVLSYELPDQMTKKAAADFVIDLPEFDNEIAQSAIDRFFG